MAKENKGTHEEVFRPEVVEIPDLNAIQLDSYKKFLDKDLDAIFRNAFPIASNNNEMQLDYVGFTIDYDGVKFNEAECKKKGRTLGVPIKAKIRLTDKDGVIEEKEIFFGDFPLMTNRGTFVINGAERVVVSQLVRSPGAIYGIDKNSQKEKENRVFYMGTIYPYRGTKLEFCLTRFKRGTGKDNGNIITVSSDKPYGDSGKKTTKSKLLLTFFMRLVGNNVTRNSIIASFYKSKEISTGDTYEDPRFFAYEDIIYSQSGEANPNPDDMVNTKYVTAGSEISQFELDQLKSAGIDKIKVIDTTATDLDDVELAVVKTLNAEKVRLAQILIKEKRADTQAPKADCLREATEIYERKENKEEFNRLMIMCIIESFKSIIPQNFKTYPDPQKITEYLRGFFLQGKGFNLGIIGRRKLEKKFDKFFNAYPKDAGNLNLDKLREEVAKEDDPDSDPENDTIGLSYDDIIMTVILLLGFYNGKIKEDDQDSLSNRRVWTVGEQLQSVLREAFGKMAKSAKDKMSMSGSDGKIKPHEIISIKPIVGAVKEFFGSSQLSQFMDQINPLAALTHRRRLTSLGPRGIGKDAARQLYDTRSVNPTHYGRICPVETPEGSNIGLILSLALYAKVDKYGFLITPYRNVINSYVTSDVKYYDSSEEEDYNVKIAPATTRVNEDCHDFLDKRINVRCYNEFETVTGVEDGTNNEDQNLYKADEITHMDVSRAQILSPSAALVPFIQYADPHRILMAVNEYRQAVPLLYPEEPHIKRPKNFEIEKKIAFDSGVMVIAKHAGTVTYVSSQYIRVKLDHPEIEGEEEIYELIKYQRTNQDTCFNQKPIVNVGDHVEENNVLADGPSTKNGELALGQTMICGYISIEGKNHEDTMLVSKELEYRNDKSGLFESVHIKEFTVDVRDTKLGMEKLTRDIPNTSEKLLQHLDSEGIVCLGTHVKQNDVLVGKVTPKGETDLTPEQKLINSIFGEKSKEVKNSSLVVPHGTEGIVIGIHRLKKDESDELQPGVEETIKVVIAEKRDILRGDKFAGRFGNKGVFGHKIHQVDMPVIRMAPPTGPLTPLQKRAREIFDGKSIEATLDPLGIISRMNDGALIYMKYLTLEKLLGKDNIDEMAPFEAFDLEKANRLFKEAGLPEDLKFDLYDGQTGEPIRGKVFVGVNQYIKLNHLVDDKMHARSTGPYSIVTQQPLGGRAMFGGQRVGEMEVWAFEAYGAANTLQELLTIKSDDMDGRTKVYESIVKGGGYAPVSLPESFNVLVQELRGLALDMSVYDENGKAIPITDHDGEIERKAKEI